MGHITLRVLEGLERGKVFANLTTPVTIGREDDNDIQLNDERVSRFHAKIQEDKGQFILTDLDSTNGTRVNGHPVQIKILYPGDLIIVGRSVLLFSASSAQHLSESDETNWQQSVLDPQQDDLSVNVDEIDFLPSPQQAMMGEMPLFVHGPPSPVKDLPPLQCAQVSDMLAYLHEQLKELLLHTVEEKTNPDGQRVMVCPWSTWQRIIHVEATLAAYLRSLSDPE